MIIFSKSKVPQFFSFFPCLYIFYVLVVCISFFHFDTQLNSTSMMSQRLQLCITGWRYIVPILLLRRMVPSLPVPRKERWEKGKMASALGVVMDGHTKVYFVNSQTKLNAYGNRTHTRKI